LPTLWKIFGKVEGAAPSTSGAAQTSSDDVPMMGIKLIKEFEGCHLNAYPDPLTGGLPITIGWGSTRDKNGQPFQMGDKITQQEADELLISQCKNQFLPALRKIPHWSEMSDGKRGALLSFAYNLGAGFYGGDNFNTITKRLKNKEWDLVPDALFLYRNPGSNVEAGLARRRKAEGESWKKG
jgi:GH24 family phage-related lysozyme (muramidase)